MRFFFFNFFFFFFWLICFGCWPFMAFRPCIEGRFHHVHAFHHIQGVSVHARCLMNCLLGIFSLIWTQIGLKLWDFLCFLIRNTFGLLVVNFTHLAPHVNFSCLVHLLHIVTSCTHLHYPCHALVYILFPHSQHVMFTLCFVALCF